MYKLYNVKAWGSLSVHCLLEEMEVPYTNIWMTVEQVRAPEFREISPFGLIPALELAHGRSLFESAVIVTFLVTAHAEKGVFADARQRRFRRVSQLAASDEHRALHDQQSGPWRECS